ncbi:helix-turn-helix domain-containing protein [uncultured Clostridium sp.]|uniref:helix-turn-helix domain-containing protein n=1 Tax=uncultured Clostridium sp. TaxID=59620 RepID=UPI00260152F0|nr:helix-turn-helix domain-containing protein [uncultured Clostridium sp.]
MILGYAIGDNIETKIGKLNMAGCDSIYTDRDKNSINYSIMMKNSMTGCTIIISDIESFVEYNGVTLLIGLIDESILKNIRVKSEKDTWFDTVLIPAGVLSIVIEDTFRISKNIIKKREMSKSAKVGVKLDKKADIDLARRLYKEGNYTTEQIAKMCNMSRATLWRKLKALGEIE